MDVCLVVLCCGVFIDSHNHVAADDVVDLAPEVGVALRLEELVWGCVGEDAVELSGEVYK